MRVIRATSVLLSLSLLLYNMAYAVHAQAASGDSPVNGVCGASSGTSADVTPPEDLCRAGTATEVAGSGPWFWSCVGSSGGTPAQCAAAPPIYPLAVSGRHLVDRNGSPFMIVGDSPQAIINISLTGYPSMDTYFRNRGLNGFNSLWINLICSAYTFCPADGKTYDGIPPFTELLSGNGCPDAGVPACYDLTTENPTYFARMDAIIDKAASYGFLIFLDPISTDGCGGWMQTLLHNGAARASSYGDYIGRRYKNSPNIIWMNGNDFQCWTSPLNDNLVADVVQGMRSGGDTHIQTSELNYDFSSSKDDTGPMGAFITLNGVYSYLPTYDEVLRAYDLSSLPVFMEEANYEFDNDCCEPGIAVSMMTLRKQEYWTMLSGATGQLYGNHYTTNFASGWPQFLDTPGMTHLRYMKNLFAVLPWYDLVADRSHAIMTAGYGTYSGRPNGILGLLPTRRLQRWVIKRVGHLSITSNDYATAASVSSVSGTLVVAYIPTVRPVTINMTKLGPDVVARWYDPTSGKYTTISGSPFINTGSRIFAPPANNSAGDTDWVLLLQGGAL